VTRSIKKWSDEADTNLQDCFASTDWNMLRDSSYGIEEYTMAVIGFINKCIDDVVSTVTVLTYPNQKPLSRSGTLTRKLIRNPATPSDEPSNRQSVNTGLRSNRATPAIQTICIDESMCQQ
jgi:hypothetical protein